MSCTHQHPYWNPAPRCAGCGHRQADSLNRPPARTRELPAVLWPFEIASRIEARLRGRLARRGKLPL